MEATRYKAFTGGNWARAKVLEQLVYWDETTTYRDEFDKPVMVPRLKSFGVLVRLHKGTISKALKWLCEQGYILIKRIALHGQPRLQIRLLIRPRQHLPQHPGNTSGNTPGNTPATHIPLDTPENSPNTPDIPATPERAGILAMSLKGPVSGALARLKQKQGATRARAREKPPAPKAIALEWNRLLREYGYTGFDVGDGKHLRHTGKTIKLFGLATTEAFMVELERRVSIWPDARPKALGKAPPHPWAINRTDILFQNSDELAFTDAETQALGKATATPAVGMEPDKDNQGSQLAKPVLWQKPKSALIKPKAPKGEEK